MKLIELDMLSAIRKWKRWKSSNTKFIPNADPSYGIVCLYDQVIAHIDPREKKATWGTIRTWNTQTTRSRLRALGILDQVLALKGASYDPSQTFLSGLQMTLDLLEPVVETKPITAADFEIAYNPPLYHGFASPTTMGVDFSSATSNDIPSVARGAITTDEAQEILRRSLADVRRDFNFSSNTPQMRGQIRQLAQEYFDQAVGHMQETYRVNVIEGERDQILVDLEITPTRLF